MWYTKRQISTNDIKQNILQLYFSKQIVILYILHTVLLSPDYLTHNFKYLHKYPYKCCSFQAPFCAMFHGSNEHCIIESSLK